MATAGTITPMAGAVIDYPESDGEPMADNTKQFEWIVTIKENLDRFLREAFVAGDLFWYPIAGDNMTKQAPDVLVALGRPKGHRGSYKQWEEQDVAPQVVFEILSPGNRAAAMREKERFYERHGVLEYYIYDPDANVLQGWRRQADEWQQLGALQDWVSPLLGIRFVLTAETMEISRGDGSRFETFAELSQRVEDERQAREVERQAREVERQAKEAALAQVTQERQAREVERQAKEAALAQVAQERQANAALRAELARLQQPLAAAGEPPPGTEALPDA